MRSVTIALKLFCICFWAFFVLTQGTTNKQPATDWWCDETECFYSDTIPKEDNCETNKSIPYRFNSTTGICELNLIGLLLSLRVLNNGLGAIVEKKNRKRSEIIFQGIINSGKMFVGFVSVCVFVGCFYCCWVQYSDCQLKKSLKVAAKKALAQQKNKATQNVGNNENQEIVKPGRCNTIREEFCVSVV